MVCFCVLRVFVYVLGLKVFVCFNCDVWRDVVWPVLRVFVLKSLLFMCCVSSVVCCVCVFVCV